MSEITEDAKQAAQDDDDGYNVIEEVSLSEWVDYDYDHHSEYVHLVADEEAGELRCYRSITEPGVSNERIKTTIDNVRFRYYFEGDERDIKYWYLTYMQAETFMSFVDFMSWFRYGEMTFEWSESDGGPMMDEEATSMECITMTFTKPNDVERHAQIRSEWQSAKSHKMANVEGDTY